jgi:Methyltransferase domain
VSVTDPVGAGFVVLARCGLPVVSQTSEIRDDREIGVYRLPTEVELIVVAAQRRKPTLGGCKFVGLLRKLRFQRTGKDTTAPLSCRSVTCHGIILHLLYLEHLDAIRDAKIDKIVSFFPAGARILEIGAGTGKQALELQRRGFAVTAIDISGSTYAAQRVSPIRDYDGWTFPLPGGRVDSVFSSNVLEQQTFPACTQRSAAYSRPAASAFMLTRDESKRPPDSHGPDGLSLACRCCEE